MSAVSDLLDEHEQPQRKADASLQVRVTLSERVLLHQDSLGDAVNMHSSCSCWWYCLKQALTRKKKIQLIH